MLGNGIFHHLTVLCHSIKLNLLCILQELRHHHRILLRNLGGHFQEVFQFFFIVAHIHRSAGEHIRRTHQYRITHFFNESLHVFQAGQLLPCRLVNAKLVEHGREFVAVFCAVDRDGRSTQHRHRLAVELHGKVVRNLSAYGHDYAARLFKVDDVEYTFKRKFIEVQAVAHVVVGGHRFRVVVNHD